MTSGEKQIWTTVFVAEIQRELSYLGASPEAWAEAHECQLKDPDRPETTYNKVDYAIVNATERARLVVEHARRSRSAVAKTCCPEALNLFAEIFAP